MKVLMISGDARMFEPGTEAHARFELQKSQVEVLDAVVWGPANFWSLFAVLAQARRARYGVVTAQDPLWRGLLAWCAAKITGANLQVQVHGDLLVAEQGLRLALAKFVLRRADSVRVVSEKIKKEIEPLRLRARVAVLPVYVDLEAVRRAPAADLKSQYPHFTHIMLAVGRLEPEKNMVGALRVLAEVLRALPGTGLLIAGTGSQEHALKKLAHLIGVAEQVIFLGYRSDLASLYKGADLMLTTSLHESWGAAMVEALAAGCPVVAPDVGVAREAGAKVVAREKLADAALEVLKSGVRGSLTLPLLAREEWAREWLATL